MRLLIVTVVFSAILTICGCDMQMQAEPLVADDVLSAATATLAGDGDCCVEAAPNFPRKGCNVVEIEACVCSVLPGCCTDNWDLQCVGLVTQSCGGCSVLSDEERAVVALLVDSDGDGMLDLDEIIAGLNPFNRFDGPDIDGDGIENGDDPDVDGDGKLNAYDDDVDGDGIENGEDDDIDGDGLLNRILDDDDDGDGIDNLIDNDDDADGFPDRKDFEFDDDDDPDEDNDDEDEEDVWKAMMKHLQASLLSDEKPVPTTPSEALSQVLVEKLAAIDTTVRLCQNDNDCGLDEVCALISCVPDEATSPANDRDGDGLRDALDINSNRTSDDLDRNNNGVPDYFELLFERAVEFKSNVLPDVTIDVKPDDLRIELFENRPVDLFKFIKIKIVDNEAGDGSNPNNADSDLDPPPADSDTD